MENIYELFTYYLLFITYYFKKKLENLLSQQQLYE